MPPFFNNFFCKLANLCNAGHTGGSKGGIGGKCPSRRNLEGAFNVSMPLPPDRLFLAFFEVRNFKNFLQNPIILSKLDAYASDIVLKPTSIN